MADKKLSKNFLLSEMLYSSTANKKYTDGNLLYPVMHETQYNPSIEIVDNMQTLVTDLLQPLRDKFTFPINITSGFRCYDLNEVIGGSKSSHHLRGMASDVSSQNNAVLFDIVVNNFKFTQAIWYYSRDINPDFLHLSYDPQNLKCQMLACKLVPDYKGIMRRTYIAVDEDYARIAGSKDIRVKPAHPTSCRAKNG